MNNQEIFLYSYVLIFLNRPKYYKKSLNIKIIKPFRCISERETQQFILCRDSIETILNRNETAKFK